MDLLLKAMMKLNPWFPMKILIDQVGKEKIEEQYLKLLAH
jgi:hypothetical protein